MTAYPNTAFVFNNHYYIFGLVWLCSGGPAGRGTRGWGGPAGGVWLPGKRPQALGCRGCRRRFSRYELVFKPPFHRNFHNLKERG